MVLISFEILASAWPAQMGQEANKLNRFVSKTINFLSLRGFNFCVSLIDLHYISNNKNETFSIVNGDYRNRGYSCSFEQIC